MSYDNTKYWFDEFNPSETLCLALLDKGMKWHKKDKLFEDCCGVYWSEEVVFAAIDKLIKQTILSTEIRGLRLIRANARELMLPSSPLIDEVTHLSLEGFNEYLQEIRKVVING